MFDTYEYSYEAILQRMLERIPSTFDKREQEPIFNALAPAAFELATAYISLAIYLDQTYLLTAVGENLDNRGADYLMARYPATYSVRIGEMKNADGDLITVPVGSRFSTIGENSINFAVTEHTEAGRCLLAAETLGVVGNEYLGELLPISFITDLATAELVGTDTPGRDVEDDESFRGRIIVRLSQKAFGGNITDYKVFTRDISGVGDVKVFPVWDGGGTVKVSVIDAEYLPCTPEFLENVQTILDPVPNQGVGLGTVPIGHRVTVVTPETVAINIDATVQLQAGYAVGQLQGDAAQAMDGYIRELRRLWADSEALTVIIARITAALINMEGIENVTGVQINGAASDLVLTQTPLRQELPVLGSVILHED